MKFFYTYLLQSEKNPNRFYTGFTEDLESRLKGHNAGQDPLKLQRTITYIAGTSEDEVLSLCLEHIKGLENKEILGSDKDKFEIMSVFESGLIYLFAPPANNSIIDAITRLCPFL